MRIGWNPYWQQFSGERYFQHRAPIDGSCMTRWRQRLGESGAEQMLRAAIETGIKMGGIRPAQLKRITQRQLDGWRRRIESWTRRRLLPMAGLRP